MMGVILQFLECIKMVPKRVEHRINRGIPPKTIENGPAKMNKKDGRVLLTTND